MKHLDDCGLLDGTNRKTLNVVMDNCAGQNKNNHVLRLAPYLVKKGYFEEAHFIFLVVGHTKNVADHLFNILKKLYPHQKIFTREGPPEPAVLVRKCDISGGTKLSLMLITSYYYYY
jgi:hypothetical protein